MNYALKTIQNEKKIKQFEELYEDIIPIHLIESCQFNAEILIQNEKSGGGVYDMEITAKLLYNLYNSTIENNDITTLNPNPFDTGIRGDFGNNNTMNV